MEDFRKCEKETKTKAYSIAGLAAVNEENVLEPLKIGRNF